MKLRRRREKMLNEWKNYRRWNTTISQYHPAGVSSSLWQRFSDDTVSLARGLEPITERENANEIRLSFEIDVRHAAAGLLNEQCLSSINDSQGVSFSFFLYCTREIVSTECKVWHIFSISLKTDRSRSQCVSDERHRLRLNNKKTNSIDQHWTWLSARPKSFLVSFISAHCMGSVLWR